METGGGSYKEAVAYCQPFKDRYDKCFNHWYRQATASGQGRAWWKLGRVLKFCHPQDEALKLMEQKAKFGGEPPPFSGENGFENQKWRNFVYEARGGVPVEGLPQETVYTVVGAFSAGFFLLGIWKFLTSERIGVRHRLGPEWLRPDGDLRTFAPESAPPQPRTLRRALEGMKELS
eukprot:g4580.t1